MNRRLIQAAVIAAVVYWLRRNHPAGFDKVLHGIVDRRLPASGAGDGPGDAKPVRE